MMVRKTDYFQRLFIVKLRNSKSMLNNSIPMQYFILLGVI